MPVTAVTCPCTPNGMEVSTASSCVARRVITAPPRGSGASPPRRGRVEGRGRLRCCLGCYPTLSPPRLARRSPAEAAWYAAQAPAVRRPCAPLPFHGQFLHVYRRRNPGPWLQLSAFPLQFARRREADPSVDER